MNDSMGQYVPSQVVKLMLKNDIKIKCSKILVLGNTFKENYPNNQNTKVIDVMRNLRDYETQVDIQDPWANLKEVKRKYGLDFYQELENCPQQRQNLRNKYDSIVLAVSH